MSASRKLYIDTADEFGRVLADLQSADVDAIALGVWATMRDAAAAAFKRDNVNFDREKFIAHTFKVADECKARRVARSTAVDAAHACHIAAMAREGIAI